MSARSDGVKTAGDEGGKVVEAGMEFLKNVRQSPDAPSGAALRTSPVKFRVIGSSG